MGLILNHKCPLKWKKEAEEEVRERFGDALLLVLKTEVGPGAKGCG